MGGKTKIFLRHQMNLLQMWHKSQDLKIPDTVIDTKNRVRTVIRFVPLIRYESDSFLIIDYF